MKDEQSAGLLESAPDAMIIVDRDGKIVMVNGLTESMFGYNRTALIGQAVEILIPDAFQTRHRAHIANYFDDIQVRPMGQKLSLSGKAHDGREFSVEISLGPVETESGTLVLAAVRDVTDQRRAEAETLAVKAKAAEIGENLTIAIESIAEGLVLYDPDGRLVLCNSVFREFYGYSDADTEPGVATYESLGRIDEMRDGTGRKRRSFTQYIADFHRAGTGLVTETEGDRVIERRQNMTADGGIISVQIDVTDRKQADGVLQERIKFSDLLQRITIAANLATSVEGVLQFWLDEVCAVIGWPVGHVFLVEDDESGDVISTKLWRLEIPEKRAWIKRNADDKPFTPGQGLIGQVLASGLPVWIVDVTKDPTFERTALAETLGIRAGFAVPVLTGLKVVAIIEFFSYEAVEPDGHMLEIVAQIGTQIGRVIERRAAEYAHRERIEAAELLQKITVAANQALTIDGALQFCLDEVCATTGWPMGHVYMAVDDDSGDVVSTGLWHLDFPTHKAWADDLKEGSRFTPGKGLTGQVLASGRPVWIADVTQDPSFERARLAEDLGIKAGFAFPVLSGSKIVAIIEFFSHEAIEPNRQLFDVMAQIGTQLGRVIERHAAESALRESEERFRFVMDNSPAAINLKDMEDRYILVNARFEEWYGLTAADVIGKAASEVFPQLKLAPFVALEREVMDQKTPSEREFEIDFADGKRRLILGSKFLVNDGQGVPMGIGTIETDISEARRLETELRQAQKMEAVGQLTGGVAHDFNNLLAVISGNLDLLNETLEGDEKRQELLNWAIKAADDAATLTRQLLAFSRQTPLNPRAVLINDLVNSLQIMLSRTLGEGIEIETDLCEEIWLTTVDPVQFENAVLNLVLNARDAMPDGGVVTIASANVTVDGSRAKAAPDLAMGDYVKLSVSDTGRGLSREMIGHAFEPFYTTKDVGQGSGLGLSMVYGFSKQSGGGMPISIASKARVRQSVSICPVLRTFRRRRPRRI